MFIWTRLFASRLASTAFRNTTRYAHIHGHLPLVLPLRAFSTGNPTILAAAAAARRKTTRSSPKKASTTKAKTSMKTKPKSKTKSSSPAKSRGRAKASRVKATRKTRVSAKTKKATAPKKPPSTRVLLKERPPTKPPASFFLYLRRTSNPAGRSMADTQKAALDAAATWRNMSQIEKQPFFDEFKVLMDDYHVRREKWYKDPNNIQVLRRLNQDRKKRGKTRIHVPSGITKKRPLTSFFRYLQDLRETNAISRESAPSDIPWARWIVREGAARWKALPDTEKNKYTKAYQSEINKSA